MSVGFGDDLDILGDLGSFGSDEGCQPADEVLSWLLVNADNINANDDIGLPLHTPELGPTPTPLLPNPTSITSRLLGGMPFIEGSASAPVGPSSGPLAAPVVSSHSSIIYTQSPTPTSGNDTAATGSLSQHSHLLSSAALYALSTTSTSAPMHCSMPPLAFQPHTHTTTISPRNSFFPCASTESLGGASTTTASSMGAGGGLGGMYDGYVPMGMPRTESMESFFTVGSEASDDDSMSYTHSQSQQGHSHPPPNQDKKKRRLEKNRESARECRRRQRAHAEELAGRVQALQAENNHLRNHLQSVQQRVQGLEKQKLMMEQDMDGMLKRDCTEEEMARFLEQFKQLYADYGVQRRKEVHFHLSQLEGLLLPTQTTKMTLWTLEQDESWFTDTGRTSLSAILMKHLGVTPEQKSKIQSRRERIRQLVGRLKKSLTVLKQLKDNVESRHKDFDTKMSGLESLLTAKQRSQLILWVTRNEQMLAKVIPGFTHETFGMDVKAEAGGHGRRTLSGAPLRDPSSLPPIITTAPLPGPSGPITPTPYPPPRPAPSPTVARSAAQKFPLPGPFPLQPPTPPLPTSVNMPFSPHGPPSTTRQPSRHQTASPTAGMAPMAQVPTLSTFVANGQLVAGPGGYAAYSPMMKQSPITSQLQTVVAAPVNSPSHKPRSVIPSTALLSGSPRAAAPPSPTSAASSASQTPSVPSPTAGSIITTRASGKRIRGEEPRP